VRVVAFALPRKRARSEEETQRPNEIEARVDEEAAKVVRDEPIGAGRVGFIGARVGFLLTGANGLPSGRRREQIEGSREATLLRWWR
jgi:hypothetical protein